MLFPIPDNTILLMFSVHWLSLSVIIGPLFPVSLQYQLFLKVVTNIKISVLIMSFLVIIIIIAFMILIFIERIRNQKVHVDIILDH